MTEPPYWFPDVDPDAEDFCWVPVLAINDCCFPLPIWHRSEDECRQFIATIPAGGPTP